MGVIDLSILGYQGLGALLTIAGMWMIMKKCGQKGWYALIPGYRYFKFGQIGGRQTDGYTAMYIDFADIFLRYIAQFVPETNEYYVPLLIIRLIVALCEVIYVIRVVLGVVQVFQAKKIWAFVWAALPWLPAMILGFSKKYQPVMELQDVDESMAGTAPADLTAAYVDTESADGLMVHVKERSILSRGARRYLLKDINLAIPNGSLVLLLGGSGAGKTTLINAIIGYEKAKAVVKLGGRDIYKEYKEMKYRIGFVPQMDLLRVNDSVRRTLTDAAKLRLPKNVGRAERNRRVNEVVETLGLTGRTQGLVAKKSGGQKKRISIGMELISNPDLFILDEPDSGLDGVIARELFEKLRGIADEGKIVIAITHTPDRVADLFDKVIVLARDSGRCGRLAFYGSPDEAREFFGKDTMEKIVMTVNPTTEGGEGRADEMIEKYAALTAERRAGSHA
ncbi:MAG: ABC transporter ATP-binding protein [Erysipelotrichaceae bacterium]|nr:ABC transporter ATP-binding protein [Erysipelotrichaceae bacterium]